MWLANTSTINLAMQLDKRNKMQLITEENTKLNTIRDNEFDVGYSGVVSASGVIPYLVEIVLFIFLVTFEISCKGFNFFPLSFSSLLPFNRSFLNCPIFCSAANALPPLTLV